MVRIDAVQPWNSPSFIPFRCNRLCAANQTIEKKINVCVCKCNCMFYFMFVIVCFITLSDVAQSRFPILD